MQQTPDIGDSILQGLQIGQVIRRGRDQRAALDAADATRKQYAADLQATFDLGTPEAFARLIANNPGQREPLAKAWDMLNDAQKENQFRVGVQAFAALQDGKPEVAVQLLDKQIAAATNAKQPVDNLKMLRTALESNPDQVKNQLGLVLSSIDADRWGKVTAELDQREKSPSELLKLKSEAAIKEAEARLAPDVVLANYNLTQQQIATSRAAQNASLAATRLSGAEAKAKEAEAKQLATGVIPITARPALEADFRKEYATGTKVYQDVKSSYGRTLASEDSAVGDLSLIFGYMKMLDPGSVVREGEFANAENATGVPSRVQNIYNKVANGERLSQSQRDAFKGQAKKLYEASAEQEATFRSGITRIAKGYGLNTDNIFMQSVETAPTGGKAVVVDY
jgi:hypothetical protein